MPVCYLVVLCMIVLLKGVHNLHVFVLSVVLPMYDPTRHTMT